MANKEDKRIYKNTVIMYVRMIIVTFVGLFSSRFVLQALGASDYGLYHVVGGLIAMLNFIVTAMMTTTRRYINIEMGKTNGDLNMVFNISLLLHIGFALFILVVAESVGIWYIINFLNVAPGKESDAMFVFQVSTIIACLGIVNVPYQSLIEAHEKFGKSAIIDVSTTLVKFGLIILLLYYKGNALRFYALLMCSVTLVSFVLYHWVCYRSWPSIIKHHIYRKSPLYKEMLVFNNYTALGAAASIGKTQGAALIINYFFGTVVNAAFSVAYQVETYVYMFVNKLTIASNPQVAKNYSGDNMERVNYIVDNNSRYCILIMIIFFFPLIAEIDFILNVWLKNVPEGAVFLCTLTLIDALVKSFTEGTNGLIQASGKIKWFQIVSSIISLLNLPVGFLLFSLGFEAYWIIVTYIFTTILNRVITLILMQKLLGFNVKRYLKNAYLPPLLVIIVMTILVILYRFIVLGAGWYHVVGIIVILLITAICVFYIGLSGNERGAILRRLKSNRNRTVNNTDNKNHEIPF